MPDIPVLAFMLLRKFLIMKNTVLPCRSWAVAAAGALLACAGFAAPVTGPVPAPERPDFPRLSLARVSGGREAIASLGTQLPAVARAYGTTASGLTTRFQTDPGLRADKGGRLVYVCAGPQAAPVTTIADPGASSTSTPVALADTFLLHSRPGASRVIYLDFDGNTTTGTLWNSNFTGGASIYTPPYDIDGVPSSFSNTELSQIQWIWERVAEDYAAFDVDVTTEDPGVEALRKTTNSDTSYGIRVCIGGSSYDWFGQGAGGVSYVGCFNWSSDTPNFVFPAQLGNGNEKYTAEAVSHEVGHSLGLNHDGLTTGASYYSGQGSGATGWAPIMGVGYYQPVVQWSKGEYANANNLEDDLAVIASYVGYRPDDHGNTAGTATYLPAGSQVSAKGVIGSAADVDVVAFTTGAGTVSLTLGGDLRSPDIDILAELRDSSGTLLATSNPPDGLGATFTATLPAGTYFVFIRGTGFGDPATTGYSAYASIGQWGLTGTVVDPGGGLAPIASASATPTTAVAPATITFDASGSVDQDGFITGYSWAFSDGTTGSGATVSKSVTVAGTFTGTVTVTDNSGLTASKSVSVTISAPNQPPVVVASATTTSGVAPLAVSFAAGSSYDPDGSISAYRWTFGDGTSSTSADVTKTYTAAGSYTATVTVTDNQGATASQSFPISVSPDPSTVIRVQSIALAIVSGRGRATVKITNLSGAAVSGATVTGTWSGISSGNVSGTTDATGTVVLQTSPLKKSGTLTFTVKGVSKTGTTYDPTKNVVSSASL